MPPGSNFVHEMDKAIAENEGLIAVLSPDYLQSSFCKSEWQAFYQKDPNGEARVLIPVRVRECQPQGLLSQRVYIDLVGKAQDDARQLLIAKVKAARKKVETPERFIHQLPEDGLNDQVNKSAKSERIVFGPNIVTAWFRFVVNPLLIGVRAEKGLLERQKWTWRALQSELEHICPIRNLVGFHQDSLVEFLRLHPDLAVLVAYHDEDRARLIKGCDQLQQLIEQNEAFLLLNEQANARPDF